MVLPEQVVTEKYDSFEMEFVICIEPILDLMKTHCEHTLCSGPGISWGEAAKPSSNLFSPIFIHLGNFRLI